MSARALQDAQWKLQQAQDNVDEITSVHRAGAAFYAQLPSIASSTTTTRFDNGKEVRQWWFGECLYVEVSVSNTQYIVTHGKEGYDFNGTREDWPLQSTAFPHSEMANAVKCFLATHAQIQAEATAIEEARANYAANKANTHCIATHGKEGNDFNGTREDWPLQSTAFAHSEMANECFLATHAKIQAEATAVEEARRCMMVMRLFGEIVDLLEQNTEDESCD